MWCLVLTLCELQNRHMAARTFPFWTGSAWVFHSTDNNTVGKRIWETDSTRRNHFQLSMCVNCYLHQSMKTYPKINIAFGEKFNAIDSIIVFFANTVIDWSLDSIECWGKIPHLIIFNIIFLSMILLLFMFFNTIQWPNHFDWLQLQVILDYVFCSLSICTPLHPK